MKLKLIAVLTVLLSVVGGAFAALPMVDYEDFLGRHDMLWDRVPNRWEVAPYTGNGNVGFLFYQAEGEAKNVISIYAGRHDYYDHREPHEGNENLWIYRSRLPLGHFKLESKGDIVEANLRLDLWNAEMVGTIKTTQGSYAVRGFSHSLHDVIYFETDASGGEAIKVSWHPEVPFAPVRATLDAGGGPKGGTWDRMRTAPYELPPAPVLSEEGGIQFCFQALYKNRGETTTGWDVRGQADGRQVLLASIHHSFPEHNSRATVKENLLTARALLAAETFFSSHRKWWHEYYPLSFLTINDPEKEAFYWIQMYKFASATRGNGPVMDLMGPWYHKTFWPMVWGDLNVELQYWTHLTANRLDAGSSLCNWFDKNEKNLYGNVPTHWKDSMGLSTCFPQDLVGSQGGNVPDMLCWILHNYWLHCEFEGDRERMRDGLFPKLRATVNSYRNYLKDNPVPSDDGTIHIKHSWSPEYPGGRGQDINFTIGLMRWSLQTLLDINEEHKLNDPLASEWQDMLDRLVEFQIDEDGLRIGKDIAFDKPHRHYSHLLPFYPLAVLTPDTNEGKELMRTSLDHWLDVTFNRKNEASAMAVTGYTATGAASMYAWLGDSDQAYHYLDYLIKHNRVSPTTMYAEGNPVIESPLSFATCIHDMLLQSWGGKTRVFPAAPKLWGDVAFKDFRAQGAFLVSAKKKDGVTEFVTVESLVGSPCFVQTDIAEPKIYINGKPAIELLYREFEDGMFQIALGKGDRVTFTPVDLEKTEFDIQPIPVSDAEHNLFGLSEKTKRLPGHAKYYPESGAAKKASTPAAAPKTASKHALPKVTGQTVRIALPGDDRVLSLAEVEVFSGGKNVAQYQKAASSSTVYGGNPERAVDGNTNGNYNDHSVTHTAPSSNPWWEVDLGAEKPIEKIVVYNRRGNADRLDGFSLEIRDAKGTVVFSKQHIPRAQTIVISAEESATSSAGTASDRPNVIFIKTDDQRFDSLGMTGHPVTKTPNIDRLAKEGVFFENAFITSPICGPSRANFFSGQWERRNRHGFFSVSRNHMTHETFDNSWLMRLKVAGYFTGYIGKNHVTVGEQKEKHGYMKQSIDFCYMRSGHLGFDLHSKNEFKNLRNSSQVEGLYEATEAFLRSEEDKEYFFENAHASLKDFLKHRDTDRPFGLSINFNLPHEASIGGMGGKESDPEMYRTLYNEVRDQQPLPIGYPNPVSLPADVFTQEELMGYYQNLNEKKLIEKKTRMSRAVTAIDAFVGRLRKDLDALGVGDNTILVFASDHGLLLGEHGLGGKTFLYEESIRIPMIFYSPHFPTKVRGTTVDELVVGQDVPATILELCRLPVPETYQGQSMVPLMAGKKVDWRKEVFCENLFTDQGYPRMEAVRGTEWKYIRYFSKENDRKKYLPDASINGEQPIYEELFNIRQDPNEQVNLADNPECRQILEDYRRRCQELVVELSE